MSDRETLALVMDHPALHGARERLARYRDRTATEPLSQSHWEDLEEIKRAALRHGDQQLAKAVWCLETISTIQERYLAAFSLMRQDAYFDAWCALERCEVNLHHLERHFPVDGNTFGLELIQRHTDGYQSLYPYRVFFSPEILRVTELCSICGERVTLWNRCGHRPGEIYDGQMCGRHITEARLVGVSVVGAPDFKMNVVFPTNPQTGEREDHYNYEPVRYVRDRVDSPWNGWTLHWTKERHPHSNYAHVPPSDPCPCRSGKAYRECCLLEQGVLRPHAAIEFEKPIPPELQATIYF